MARVCGEVVSPPPGFEPSVGPLSQIYSSEIRVRLICMGFSYEGRQHMVDGTTGEWIVADVFQAPVPMKNETSVGLYQMFLGLVGAK